MKKLRSLGIYLSAKKGAFYNLFRKRLSEQIMSDQEVITQINDEMPCQFTDKNDYLPLKDPGGFVKWYLWIHRISEETDKEKRAIFYLIFRRMGIEQKFIPIWLL